MVEEKLLISYLFETLVTWIVPSSKPGPLFESRCMLWYGHTEQYFKTVLCFLLK